MLPFLVIGTRPEIVKMASILWECESRGISYYFLHTGQHYSKFMSDSFLTDLELRNPDANLSVGSGTQSEQTAKALVGIERELVKVKPDVVIVQGDTNAVLSAAIAAVKIQIPVAHVEAGLRSYDVRMPEEHNRRLTDHASKFLFAPTESSAQILRDEKVWGNIHVTGNTVIDSLERSVPKAKAKRFPGNLSPFDKFALLTLHRAENVDDKDTLEGIVKGLLSLDVDIVFPAHPRTVARLKEFDLLTLVKSQQTIHMIEPVGYLDFLNLMARCSFVLTDSGGIQEEVTAPSLNKRVFVLRTSTERPEAVNSGHALVVGINPDRFPNMIREAIEAGLDQARSCPYGDGRASIRILDILENEL